MPGIDLLVRVGLAALLGLVVGVERQWRARMAGLQTMSLVSMGSALYLILGAYTFSHGSDPTRVAAQIVTGVGFLGAGVIMKQGVSVTGLNTAATLWATAAVGALAGAWAWREAIAGTVIIVAGNSFLHPLAQRMDRLHVKGREVTPTEYVLEVICKTTAEQTVRVLVVQAVAASKLLLHSLTVSPAPNADAVALSVRASATERNDQQLENAVAVLGTDPTILSARWSIVS